MFGWLTSQMKWPEVHRHFKINFHRFIAISNSISTFQTVWFLKKIEVPTKVQNSKLLRWDNLRLWAMTSQLRSDVNHAPLLNYCTLASPLREISQLFDFVLKLHENVTIAILLNFSRCMCSGILFRIFAQIGAPEKSPKTKSMSALPKLGFSIQPQKILVSRYHYLYLGGTHNQSRLSGQLCSALQTRMHCAANQLP